MAASGERRLVFDTRGKRKHVVRVVYAILALLMGGSLFLVVGPVNIGALLGNSTSTNSAATVLEEQAERIEQRLAKDRTDEALLLSLTRARIGAGNAQIEPAAAGEVSPVPAAAYEDFEVAQRAWSRYLKQAGDEASVPAAQLVAATFFKLAESGSTSLEEIQSNIAIAATAQRVAAKAQPNLGSLSSLAIYEYFNGNTAAADKATKQAVAQAPSKTEAKAIEEQLAKYSENAKKFNQQAEKAATEQKKAGKEQLQNPFGGLGGPPGSE